MMKPLLLVVFIVSMVSIQAQQPEPVRWHIGVEKKQTGTYLLTVNGTIETNWYVYANDDAANGLEAIRLHYAHPKIKASPPKLLGTTSLVYDPVFMKNQNVFVGHISFSQQLTVTGPLSQTELRINAFASNETEFIAVDTTLVLVLEEGMAGKGYEEHTLANLDLLNPVADCGDTHQKEKGLLAIFFLGMAGGLLALLTPCVFPMIPVTVSFFTQRRTSSRTAHINGILYGIFILLIYGLVSLPFHLMGSISPQIFNVIATNAGVNLFFFVVFVLFALSFFGLFEIRLPSFLANKSGNRGGIFFMALTLAIVSFSCTGPILGSLLVGSLAASGNAWQLSAGMLGFGLALGLPFSLFALFPSWLKALPKSGGWMEVVKKSLAFVELALALKFLSNADLVEHWGLLKRETFIALWLLISLGLALYLFGVFEKKRIAGLQNADRLTYIPVPVTRKIIGVLVLLFAIYLLPGLTPTSHANLKLLSGFPPPLSYSFYKEKRSSRQELHADMVNDYNSAIALAKKQNKPLLIDFTGWACVNCRKMEEHVWTLPAVQDLIRENFILVSLYV
ncbi:MAG: protein-disulfide reductase DsbD family protein, partial [Chitinophagaceae bacterium]